MEVTCLIYIIFVICSIVLFYIFPEKLKKSALIGMSFFFAATYDFRNIFYLLVETFIVWKCSFIIRKIDDLDKSKTEIQKIKRGFIFISLFLASVFLFTLKYIGPITVSMLFPRNIFGIKWVVPLGMSYYTLQGISYIMDVYWGKIQPEKKYSNILLFLCFFPQMLQGPISNYSEFSSQWLQKSHRFNAKNIKYGIQLTLWGYFKVMVVATRAAVYVDRAFHGAEVYYGLDAFWGLMMFGLQLYGNFSGGIDIIRGIAQCMDITLPDNFQQPFFSKSIGEFWRRWHITLGRWMKTYIFYPISMSKGMSAVKKYLKKRLSRKMANRISIAVADVLVFLLVGLWHGCGTNYVLWGLYNGCILGFSEIMTEYYLKTKKKLRIQDTSCSWKALSIVRTFFLVTIGWCTDCATTATGSFNIIKNMCLLHKTQFEFIPTSLVTLFNGSITLAVVGILFYVDLMHEKKKSVRKELEKYNYIIQCIVWIVIIQLILGCSLGNSGGLMYADF